MILPFQQQLRAHLHQVLTTLYGLAPETLPAIVLEYPPTRALGDLATPVAFELARRLKKAPRVIGQEIAAGFGTLAGVREIQAAPSGHLNVFLDRVPFLLARLRREAATLPAPPGKAIVEHTAINPNKAAHIGHLRNSALGDTLVRALRHRGIPVEVQNYIDDTGVQVADVVVGFRHIESRSLADIRHIADTTRFDYYCWDLYARVGAWYEEDRSRLDIRARTLHQIEEGGNLTAEVAEFVSTRIVDCHLETMARLDISYDLLARESEILHLQFWAHAFEKLKASGAIVFETEGRNKGCWVMKADEGREEPATGEETEFDADKIIVRSNGTVTYTGKDIAYHLWKLGKLGLDFHYRFLRHDHRGREVWVSTGDASAASASHPQFGNGTAFLNVIDVGQSYPQANVKKGVMMIDHDERVARSAHLAYEKVTLTPAAAAELGSELTEADAQRQQIGMSGRKGLGVKADDLIDRLEQDAGREVQARHPEISAAAQQQIANQIAVAALRYFLLKYTRTSIIAFDFKEALSFDGETGPYLQYSTVRARNIFRKFGRTAEELRPDFAQLSDQQIDSVLAGEQGLELWSLVYFAGRLTDVLQVAAAGFEPTHLAKYAFQLAKQFNLFYHHHHILSESDPHRQLILLMVADVARQRLEEALAILGIEAPEMM